MKFKWFKSVADLRSGNLKSIEIQELTEEQMLIKEQCGSSFYHFVKYMFEEIEPMFMDNWHIMAIAEHLQAVQENQIKNLIINVPPRSSKTTLGSILYPAWLFIKNPHEKIMILSHGHSLVLRNAVRIRRIINSDRFQAIWPMRLSRDENMKQSFSFANTSGTVQAFSTMSNVVGVGARFRLLDDPNLLADQSPLQMEKVVEFFEGVLSTRKSISESGEDHTIIIQQRISMSDLTQHVMNKNDGTYHYLVIPMEYEKAWSFSSNVMIRDRNSGGMGYYKDPRLNEGDLMWPSYVTLEKLKELKAALGNDPYKIAGLLQQRPSPKEGAIFRETWFKYWDLGNGLPHIEYVFCSWDTAFTVTSSSAYSACVVFGIFKDSFNVYNFIVLSTVKRRVEFPDLKKLVVDMWIQPMCYEYGEDGKHIGYKANKANKVVIEAKASGYSIIQELYREHRMPVEKFDPVKHGNKEIRAKLVSDLVQEGRVWFLSKSGSNSENAIPSVKMLRHELIIFPKGDSMDVVDAFSQGLLYAKEWLGAY